MWDLRQDKRYAKYMESIGWEVDTYRSVYIYTKKIPLISLSLTKVQRPIEFVPSDELRKIARKRKSIYIFIESSTIEQEKYYNDTSFKQTTSISLPSKSIHVDSTKSAKDLLNRMSTKTRYNINRYKRVEKMITVSRDIEKFVHYWQKSAKERGMFISQKREIMSLYYQFSLSSTLYFFDDKTPSAGLMCVGSKHKNYYMHAFSTKYANSKFAPTLLAWKSIKDSLKKYSIYDFEGIYDERTNLTSWKGFSRFKQGFGGETVTYPLPQYKYVFPG